MAFEKWSELTVNPFLFSILTSRLDIMTPELFFDAGFPQLRLYGVSFSFIWRSSSSFKCLAENVSATYHIVKGWIFLFFFSFRFFSFCSINIQSRISLKVWKAMTSWKITFLYFKGLKLVQYLKVKIVKVDLNKTLLYSLQYLS